MAKGTAYCMRPLALSSSIRLYSIVPKGLSVKNMVFMASWVEEPEGPMIMS